MNPNDKTWAERWWPYALVALLGGTGGAGFKDFVVPPRPDPYTGTEARVRKEQIDAELERYRQRMDRIEARQLVLMEKIHHLPPDELLERVTIVEEAVKSLKVLRYPE